MNAPFYPSPNLYEEIQDEIRIHMRKIVTEWMLDVCLDSRCHVDVFLLATNIMDRFLATIRLQKKQFQLLGAASIFLASKMIEPQPISALTLVRNTADTYDREELLVSKILFFIMILRPPTIGRVMYRCLSATAVLPIARGFSFIDCSYKY